MRTHRLFTLALVTAVTGLAPWLTSTPIALKLFGSILTAFALLIAFLTGSVMITERRRRGCGNCDTCTCLMGKNDSADTTTAAPA